MLVDSKKLYVYQKAQEGHPKALYKLALYYLIGEYVPKCEKTALRYYKELVDQGPQAIESLERRQDYGDMAAFLAYQYLGFKEYEAAKDYLVKAALYYREKYPPCIADKLMHEERIYKFTERCNGMLDIEEDIAY